MRHLKAKIKHKNIISRWQMLVSILLSFALLLTIFNNFSYANTNNKQTNTVGQNIVQRNLLQQNTVKQNKNEIKTDDINNKNPQTIKEEVVEDEKTLENNQFLEKNTDEKINDENEENRNSSDNNTKNQLENTIKAPTTNTEFTSPFRSARSFSLNADDPGLICEARIYDNLYSPSTGNNWQNGTAGDVSIRIKPGTERDPQPVVQFFWRNLNKSAGGSTGIAVNNNKWKYLYVPDNMEYPNKVLMGFSNDPVSRGNSTLPDNYSKIMSQSQAAGYYNNRRSNTFTPNIGGAGHALWVVSGSGSQTRNIGSHKYKFNFGTFRNERQAADDPEFITKRLNHAPWAKTYYQNKGYNPNRVIAFVDYASKYNQEYYIYFETKLKSRAQGLERVPIMLADQSFNSGQTVDAIVKAFAFTKECIRIDHRVISDVNAQLATTLLPGAKVHKRAIVGDTNISRDEAIKFIDDPSLNNRFVKIKNDDYPVSDNGKLKERYRIDLEVGTRALLATDIRGKFNLKLMPANTTGVRVRADELKFKVFHDKDGSGSGQPIDISNKYNCRLVTNFGANDNPNQFSWERSNTVTNNTEYAGKNGVYHFMCLPKQLGEGIFNDNGAYRNTKNNINNYTDSSYADLEINQNSQFSVKVEFNDASRNKGDKDPWVDTPNANPVNLTDFYENIRTDTPYVVPMNGIKLYDRSVDSNGTIIDNSSNGKYTVKKRWNVFYGRANPAENNPNQDINIAGDFGRVADVATKYLTDPNNNYNKTFSVDSLWNRSHRGRVVYEIEVNNASARNLPNPGANTTVTNTVVAKQTDGIPTTNTIGIPLLGDNSNRRSLDYDNVNANNPDTNTNVAIIRATRQPYKVISVENTMYSYTTLPEFKIDTYVVKNSSAFTNSSAAQKLLVNGNQDFVKLDTRKELSSASNNKNIAEQYRVDVTVGTNAVVNSLYGVIDAHTWTSLTRSGRPLATMPLKAQDLNFTITYSKDGVQRAEDVSSLFNCSLVNTDNGQNTTAGRGNSPFSNFDQWSKSNHAPNNKELRTNDGKYRFHCIPKAFGNVSGEDVLPALNNMNNYIKSGENTLLRLGSNPTVKIQVTHKTPSEVTSSVNNSVATDFERTLRSGDGDPLDKTNFRFYLKGITSKNGTVNNIRAYKVNRVWAYRYGDNTVKNPNSTNKTLNNNVYFTIRGKDIRNVHTTEPKDFTHDEASVHNHDLRARFVYDITVEDSALSTIPDRGNTTNISTRFFPVRTTDDALPLAILDNDSNHPKIYALDTSLSNPDFITPATANIRVVREAGMHLLIRKLGKNNVPLKGASFVVREKGNTDTTKYVNFTPKQGSDYYQSDLPLDNGKTYEVIETKAPEGYMLLPIPVELNFSTNGVVALAESMRTIDAFSVTRENPAGSNEQAKGLYVLQISDLEDVTRLPRVGGFGVFWIQILGGFILLTGFSLVIYRRRRTL